jgi:hypothetical protein
MDKEESGEDIGWCFLGEVGEGGSGGVGSGCTTGEGGATCFCGDTERLAWAGGTGLEKLGLGTGAEAGMEAGTGAEVGTT